MSNKNTNDDLKQSLLDKGFNIIISAFNQQKNEYTNKIYELEIEINKLKEENNIYKNKLSILHKKLNTISKTFSDLDAENEEIKLKLDENKENKNINNMVSNNINNNDFKPRNKKNSFYNQKSILFRNFLTQNKTCNYSSFQRDSKLSSFPKNSKEIGEYKKYSQNYQYNLKYNNLNNKKKDYNKLLGNLNYLKKKNNNNDSKNQNNSDIIDNSQKDIDININNFNESKTERDFRKKKIYSEKYLNNNNRIDINDEDNSIMSNINLNINNDSDLKSSSNNNLYSKSNNYINIISNISNEDEYLKQIKKSLDNNISINKKLNIFLENCKIKLNALDFEKIINILNNFEVNSNIDLREKIKKIINNNHNLCKLFDDIFEE